MNVAVTTAHRGWSDELLKALERLQLLLLYLVGKTSATES